MILNILTRLKCAVVVGLLICLSACVTTSNSGLGDVDKERAARQYIELGMRYVQQGKLIEAKQPLKRALKINPKSSDAHNVFAILFQAEQELELADNYFKKSLELDEANTRARNNYAAFLFQQKRFNEACEQLRRASQDPYYAKRATVFENLGVCYLETDNEDAALAAFERSVDLNTGQARALLEAGRIQFQRNNIELSALYHDRYQKLVRLRSAPNTPQNLLLGLQLARISADKNKEASFYLQLKNLFPDSEEFKNLDD